MSRVTLRERFFPLHQPDDVDRFLERLSAGASSSRPARATRRSMRGWWRRQALEPRVDVAVGFIRLPEDRPASDRVTRAPGIAHRSPQLLLFQRRPRALPSRRVRDRARSARAAAARAPSGRGRTARSQRSGGHARAVPAPAVRSSSRAICPKSASSGGIWIAWRKRRSGATMRRSRC